MSASCQPSYGSLLPMDGWLPVHGWIQSESETSLLYVSCPLLLCAPPTRWQGPPDPNSWPPLLLREIASLNPCTLLFTQGRITQLATGVDKGPSSPPSPSSTAGSAEKRSSRHTTGQRQARTTTNSLDRHTRTRTHTLFHTHARTHTYARPLHAPFLWERARRKKSTPSQPGCRWSKQKTGRRRTRHECCTKARPPAVIGHQGIRHLYKGSPASPLLSTLDKDDNTVSRQLFSYIVADEVTRASCHSVILIPKTTTTPA